MVKFWDSDNMVFRFGEVEMMPTIEEVLASYESVDMCNKRKRQPDTDILFPKIWNFAEIKEKLSLTSRAKRRECAVVNRMPYAPGRVLRQLGGKQEIPQIADMKKFATDHEDGRISYVEDIRRTWKTRRVLGEPVPNRFLPECSKDYKEWLKKSLAGTIEPGSNVPHMIADDARVIAQLKQDLRRARQCISELDDSMEQQIQSVERFKHQEGARLARDHLWANRYAMWEEVGIAKRTRLGESTEGV
ncbi:hypothetical protein R3W88_005683 [Solanum pinnatisectum]|uniref:Uncharacterized protein n=1 Tax=Solanum pinnatisectum TaxID=50273 RepID=A0AAV9KFF4_9SOLN|nr:hypothetical protein R3W88_005683 [Solanum pinnatisectum]